MENVPKVGKKILHSFQLSTLIVSRFPLVMFISHLSS
jgi:hypothetical protein